MKNGKVYIGQSVEIEKRKGRHFRELKDGKHHNIHLQRAFDKYGEGSFEHIIIEKCSKDKLDEREKFWISFYNSNDYNFGYNQDSGGQEGKIMNEDSRQRIGQSRIYPNGCDTPNSLLSIDEVTDIKYMLIEGYDVGSIAEKYDVGNWVILHIRNLETYTEIAEEINEILFNLYKGDNDFEINRLILESVREKESKRKFLNRDLEEMQLIINIKKYIYENEVDNFVKVGKLFNVNDYIVINIAKCKTYKYILPEYNKKLKERYDKNLNNEKHLSDESIRQIKHYLSLGNKKITNKILANKYNVDASSISNIKLLKLYKDKFPEYNDLLKELYSDFKVKKTLSEYEVIQIKKLLLQEKHYSNSEIGEMFSVDASQISRIKNLKIHKEYGSQYNKELIKKYNVRSESVA